MIRQHKKMILLTSIATLLPILIGLLLWKQLPDSVATHFFQNHRQRTGRLLIQGFCSVRASGDHADPASGMRDRNEH